MKSLPVINYVEMEANLNLRCNLIVMFISAEMQFSQRCFQNRKPALETYSDYSHFSFNFGDSLSEDRHLSHVRVCKWQLKFKIHRYICIYLYWHEVRISRFYAVVCRRCHLKFSDSCPGGDSCPCFTVTILLVNPTCLDTWLQFVRGHGLTLV